MNAQHSTWLEEALALVPPQYRPDDVRPYLKSALKRSHSNSRKAWWQWLRLTLAKSSETAIYLTWMQESRVPPEVESTPQDDFLHTISADGTTALIPVGDDTAHGVWKVPIQYLEWAKSQTPVFLKRLPDLEPVELKRQREIRHQSHYMKTKLSFEQLESFEKELAALDEQVARLYTPVPRYCLMKWTARRDIPVHRLFIGATDDNEVEAIDGDFLNFCPVKIRVILTPVPDKDGVAGGRGSIAESLVEVNNLQIVPRSEDRQQKFEDGMLQFKWTLKGDDVVSPVATDFSGTKVWSGNGQVGHSGGLLVQPNADLGKRTGVEGGRIEDCGTFAPLTAEERVEHGLHEVRSSAKEAERRSIAEIRRNWGVKRSGRTGGTV